MESINYNGIYSGVVNDNNHIHVYSLDGQEKINVENNFKIIENSLSSILNEVFNPVLNDIQHKRFSKMIDILHEKMFVEITGNNGDGSIF